MQIEAEIKQLDLNNESDVGAAFVVMSQLRSHLNRVEMGARLQQMASEGYTLWAYVVEQKIVGLLSTREYTDLVRGTHLYIDDLVTDASERSKGVGSALLHHAEALARKKNMPTLRLACVLENEQGLKFYKREGWLARAYAMTKKL